MPFLLPNTVAVTDAPRPLFAWGHDPMAYRACLPAVEAGWSDEEAYDLLVDDTARLAEFRAVHGNRKNARRAKRRAKTDEMEVAS